MSTTQAWALHCLPGSQEPHILLPPTPFPWLHPSVGPLCLHQGWLHPRLILVHTQDLVPRPVSRLGRSSPLAPLTLPDCAWPPTPGTGCPAFLQD